MATNLIGDITIHGLWEKDKLTLLLKPDVNFLIGVNGSGKTTVIRLITAALAVDINALEKTNFRSIQIRLVNPTAPHAPEATLIVEKELHEDGSTQTFYTITSKKREISLAKMPVYAARITNIRFAMSRQASNVSGPVGSSYVRQRIHRLVRTTWLSIHRSTTGPKEGRSFESAVDERLDNLNTSIVRFLSELTSQVDAEIKNFQQTVFESVVPSLDMNEVAKTVASLDLEREQSDLREILSEFGASPEGAVVGSYFTHLKGAVEAIAQVGRKKKGVALSFQQSGALITIEIIHRIVRSWHALKERRQEIYQPKEIFLRVLNATSWRKTYDINAKNELQAKLTATEEPINISDLSSGEKQLLIILGEALLQRKLPTVYIADEPEISLHISWQEKLIDMLRELNPAAQIIFATHSPDLVSHFDQGIIDMETLLD